MRCKKIVFFYLLLVFARMMPAQTCNQTAASTADLNTWSQHGCWASFFQNEAGAYAIYGSNWGNRGWSDACNVNKEFPKHWNAAYLLDNGLADDGLHSFHATEDYRGAAEARGSQYHNSLYHVVTNDTSVFGRWIHHSGPNEVQTSCLLYDASSPNANPASRAGDFIHEGWHGWFAAKQYSNGSCNGHRCGPQGACSLPSGCDYFYFHGVGTYAFGQMYVTDGTAKLFHSPNQVQVEFLCDIADFPKTWVPASVRTAAKADANQRASQRFINGPGYTCGSPRPW